MLKKCNTLSKLYIRFYWACKLHRAKLDWTAHFPIVLLGLQVWITSKNREPWNGPMGQAHWQCPCRGCYQWIMGLDQLVVWAWAVDSQKFNGPFSRLTSYLKRGFQMGLSIMGWCIIGPEIRAQLNQCEGRGGGGVGWLPRSSPSFKSWKDSKGISSGVLSSSDLIDPSWEESWGCSLAYRARWKGRGNDGVFSTVEGRVNLRFGGDTSTTYRHSRLRFFLIFSERRFSARARTWLSGPSTCPLFSGWACACGTRISVVNKPCPLKKNALLRMGNPSPVVQCALPLSLDFPIFSLSLFNLTLSLSL